MAYKTNMTFAEMFDDFKARIKHFFRLENAAALLFYAIDWLTIVLIAVAILVFYLLVPGVENIFFEDDLSIQYPMKEDTVPVYLNIVLMILIPFVVFLFLQIFVRNLLDLHNAFITTALSIFISLAITNFFKPLVGELRPDFLDRCVPVGGVCTGDPDIIAEGRLSFPSGHTSSAFSSTWVISIYLIGKFHLFSGDKNSYIWQWLLVLLPNVYSAYVGISRLTDYRHHVVDVVTSAIYTLFVAYFSYRIYFNSLFSADSHKPRRLRFKFLRNSSEEPEDASDDDGSMSEMKLMVEV